MTLTYGQSILHAAAEAIQEMGDALSEDFDRAVIALSERSRTGRIVVSGMGKAGYIGMKLSATLASIGFPSFFLHPADALHGDLGRVSSADTIIILSHSGETSEISRLLPRLKEFGITIISITAHASSFLGSHSEIVLETGKISEAGPLGLAPTTSTSVMLALCDALAMTLIHHRGFTREEFAIFHPGGDLGRALLTVEELMRTGDAHCIVPKNMVTRDVLHAISSTRGRPGAAAIVDDSGVLIGVFTDGNLRRCLESNTTFLEQPIIEVASLHPKTVTRSQLATEAAHLIGSLQIDQLIVVDEKKHPVGLVDIQDLLSHGMIKPREVPPLV